MIWELTEDEEEPGDWRVEAVGEDGECYVTIFSGPFARARASEYKAWRNVPPEQRLAILGPMLWER